MIPVFLLLSACSTPAPEVVPAPVAAPVGPSELVVGSWNVEWLDSRVEQGRVPRTERDFAGLKRLVDAVNADIWTFQEVADADAVRRLVPDDWTVHVESRRAEQRVAWAVRPGLDAVVTEHEAIGLGRSGLRNGLQLDAAGLSLLAVHLKAGCQWDTFDRSDDCRTMGEQVTQVEAWLDAATGPAVVVGDFNRQLSREDAAWTELNDGDPAPLLAPLLDAPNRCEGARGRHPIDQVVVRGIDEEHVSVRQMREGASSDHCPVVLRFSL